MHTLVTGISGQLGSRVGEELRRRGHAVSALSRPEYSLSRAPDPSHFLGVDTVIHCAYDFRLVRPADIECINVDGSIDLLKVAIQAGVRTFVFISTVAAYEGCRSVYGLGKLKVEHEVLRHGGVVIRPGLLYSDCLDRGLIASLARVACLPVIPMIGRGQYPFYTAHVDDVAAFVVQRAEQGLEFGPAVVAAANRRPWPLAELVLSLRERQGKGAAPMFLVPPGLALGGLRMLERLGVALPFRSDSLVSMLNPDPSPPFDTSPSVCREFRAFCEGRS